MLLASPVVGLAVGVIVGKAIRLADRRPHGPEWAEVESDNENVG